ncbi:hypothetical protein KIPB_008187, partial [Kipferlia bialata]
HPYLAQFHDSSKEPICSSNIAIPLDDDQRHSVQVYRDRLYNEILKKKKAIRSKVLKKRREKAEGEGGDGEDKERERERRREKRSGERKHKHREQA